jgi:hypothetical protein
MKNLSANTYGYIVRCIIIFISTFTYLIITLKDNVLGKTSFFEYLLSFGMPLIVSSVFGIIIGEQVRRYVYKRHKINAFNFGLNDININETDIVILINTAISEHELFDIYYKKLYEDKDEDYSWKSFYMSISEKIRRSDTSILVIHKEPFFFAEPDFLKTYIKVLYNFADDEFKEPPFKVVVPLSQKHSIDRILRSRKKPAKYKQIFDDIIKQ